MIRAITITHQCGSGGMELARQIAQKLEWEVVDLALVERIARVADLDLSKVEQLDERTARWCCILKARGINLVDVCPYVEPRWCAQLDQESLHDLTAQLIQAAADLGESVIVIPGAQCLLQKRADVLRVLVHAPIEERIIRVQKRDPACADAQALLREVDTQTAKYIIEHYESEWLGAGLYLYHLCVNTTNGLEASAATITAELMRAEESCAPISGGKLSSCHLPHQL